MKYITFTDGSSLLFSESLNHADMARKVGKQIKGAGQARLVFSERRAYSWGKSFSLGTESADGDSDLITQALFSGSDPVFLVSLEDGSVLCSDSTFSGNEDDSFEILGWTKEGEPAFQGQDQPSDRQRLSLKRMLDLDPWGY